MNCLRLHRLAQFYREVTLSVFCCNLLLITKLQTLANFTSLPLPSFFCSTQSFPSFVTLALLQITGQLLCRMSLNLGLADVFSWLEWGNVFWARKSQKWCGHFRASYHGGGRDVDELWRIIFYCCLKKSPQTNSFWRSEVQTKYMAGLSAQRLTRPKSRSTGLHSHLELVVLLEVVGRIQFLGCRTEHFSCWLAAGHHSQFLEATLKFLPCGPSIYKGSRRISLLYNPSHIFNLRLRDPDLKGSYD